MQGNFFSLDSVYNLNLTFRAVNPLVPDPKTGFLQSHDNQGRTFTAEKKVKFLSIINEYINKKQYPLIHSVCDSLGIAVRTFDKHVEIDPAFGEAWREIKARLHSVFTHEMGIKALNPNGFMANVAILRYLENGTFNGESRVIHSTDNASAKAVNDRLKDAIDAEIVDDSPSQIENKT